MALGSRRYRRTEGTLTLMTTRKLVAILIIRRTLHFCLHLGGDAMCAAIEVVAIFRVTVLREPLESAMPLFSPKTHHSQSFIEAWMFIAAALFVVRASQALSIESTAAWRTTAAMHVLELLYHGYNGIVTERAFLHQPAFGPPAIVLACITVNALWFTVAWLTCGSGKLQKRA
jgi:hypothetical protein